MLGHATVLNHETTMTHVPTTTTTTTTTKASDKSNIDHASAHVLPASFPPGHGGSPKSLVAMDIWKAEESQILKSVYGRNREPLQPSQIGAQDASHPPPSSCDWQQEGHRVGGEMAPDPGLSRKICITDITTTTDDASADAEPSLGQTCVGPRAASDQGSPRHGPRAASDQGHLATTGQGPHRTKGRRHL